MPGDVLLIEEGDRVSADARLLEGAVEVDLSTLTGESLPVLRSAEHADAGPLLEARDLVFSGTTCTGGEARGARRRDRDAHRARADRGAVAARSSAKRARWRAGQTGRLADRGGRVAAGLVFLPLGALAAGLPLGDALTFAIGLIVANVPEGLLPTITLALAVGVARSRGAARW